MYVKIQVIQPMTDDSCWWLGNVDEMDFNKKTTNASHSLNHQPCPITKRIHHGSRTTKWVFPKIEGIPEWMVYNGNPYKNGWFGVPLFLETSKWLTGWVISTLNARPTNRGGSPSLYLKTPTFRKTNIESILNLATGAEQEVTCSLVEKCCR